MEGDPFVNDLDILELLLRLLLLIEVLDSQDANIEAMSCNYRIKTTNSQVCFFVFFNRTGAYLNEN